MKVLRRQGRRLLQTASVAVLVVALVGPVPAAAGTAEDSADCRDVSVPVTLDGRTGPVAGTLCIPPGADTLQVLVHGVFYARYYWQFPYKPERYSYVRAANAAGYATLAIDRVGAGESWYPPSTTVKYHNHAASVHQVIQAVRDGRLGRTFDDIVLVGHSYGSVISFIVAGEYGGVDALAITGGSHDFDLPGFTAAAGPTMLPAMLVPKFADRDLDPGYLATRPGTRDVFYNEDNAEPKVLAVDDRLRETASVADALTTLPPISAGPPFKHAINATRDVNLPVLTINGSEESFFCGPAAADCSSASALAEFERQFYGPNAQVEGYVVEGSGHALNLEYQSQEVFAVITDFLDRHLTSDG